MAKRSAWGARWAFPVWLMLITVLVGWVLLAQCGRSVYALGSSPEAARLAGIPVRQVELSVFALQGVLVGVAAMAFATRFTTTQSNTGSGFEFLVITAVVGGTNIFGGSGTLLGILLGAFLVAVTGTALTFLRTSAFWKGALQGLFILVSVALDVLRSGRAPETRTQLEEPLDAAG